MVAAGITVHHLFALVGMFPTERPSLREMVRFAINYTFFLNFVLLAAAAALLWLHFRGDGEGRTSQDRERSGGRRSARPRGPWTKPT